MKVIIQTKDGLGIPASTLVVVNPNFDAANSSLDEILAKVNESSEFADLHKYEAESGDEERNGFVMSNSVHLTDCKDKDHLLSGAVSLDGHLKGSEDEAKESPVDIYVERVVAKLSVTIGQDLQPKEVGGLSNVYDTQTTYNENDKIYVHFLGWNVTATANKSYLVKHISNEWNNELDDSNLFKTASQPWNYNQFHRSFWAINPSDDFKVEYGPFQNPTTSSTETPNVAQAMTGFVDNSAVPNFVYLPENAGKSADSPANASPSQVIIAAQLVNERGEALEMAEFGAQLFVDKYDEEDEANSYTKIKTAILSQLKEKYYYYDGPASGTQGEDEVNSAFKSIDVADIKLVTAYQAGMAPGLNPEAEDRYFVYAVLTEDAKNYAWVSKKPSASDIGTGGVEGWVNNNRLPEAVKTINDAFKKIGSAKIWKSGYTYYYFNIRHLAEPNISAVPEGSPDGTTVEGLKSAVPGYYGVVRNHVYKCEISSLSGLGTPVYDPDEVIIPEKPEEKDMYLAAKINILSWRIVDHGYDLNW